MPNGASLHEGDEAHMQSRESWPVAEYWAIEGIVACGRVLLLLLVAVLLLLVLLL